MANEGPESDDDRTAVRPVQTPTGAPATVDESVGNPSAGNESAVHEAPQNEASQNKAPQNEAVRNEAGRARTNQPARAAGAVLWRAGPGGRTEVAVVHRPRYDDWSLPKGKIDPGENAPRAAAREVAEETGFPCALSRYLTEVTYSIPSRDGGTVEKRVDYFAAAAREGMFQPNEEVDVLRWMSPASAREQLSYRHDCRVLDAFERLPTDVATLLLVRHADAGTREEFSGDDAQRPLSGTGRRQRAALHELLPLYGPERLYAAPRLRCEQTVEPVAADLGTTIGSEPLLSEESHWTEPHASLQRLLTLAAGPGPAVVCSQGGVIPDLVGRLAKAGGLRPDELAGARHMAEVGRIPSGKASVWTLTFRCDRPSGNGDEPVRLVAADYLDDPIS